MDFRDKMLDLNSNFLQSLFPLDVAIYVAFYALWVKYMQALITQIQLQVHTSYQEYGVEIILLVYEWYKLLAKNIHVDQYKQDNWGWLSDNMLIRDWCKLWTYY